jgi:hypothetical protein
VVNVKESTEKWPVLLGVGEHVPEHRELIVRLFSRMLGAAHFQRRAYLELRRWTKLAQKDASMREPLASLLFDIGTESGELDSIRYDLEYWAWERKGPKDAVRDVLQYFDRKGS